MAVNVPQSAGYQQQLGFHCTQFRNALQQIMNDAAWLNSMGGATFLEAAAPNGLGLSTADATAIMTAIGVVTPQNATVQSIQAWLATTQFLWGGS